MSKILYQTILNTLKEHEGGNLDLINYVNNHKDDWHGPITITADEIQRTVGPEEGMLHKESIIEFESRVEEIAKLIQSDQKQKALLLCEKHDSTFYLLDGNHTFEALRSLGYTDFEVIYTNDDIIFGQLTK